jgi:predicted ATPase/DNA-binding SARP family transcriptional activator
VDVAVLGPVQLRTGAGETVPVAGARLRTLLILLALDANRTVSADRLIDGVWGDDPPAAAGNALQALVSRLRRAGLSVDGTATGYRLVIDADRVDTHRFVRLAGSDPAAALALWRGPLEFPDVARADAVRLEQSRLTAQRALLAARLDRGLDVVADLEALVEAHPLDEPLAALLMRALAGRGSPGEALAVYEATRQRLADALGTDPTAELTAVYLDLLRAGPAPRGNLPAEVSSFVGRDRDVRAVRELTGGYRLVTLLGPGGSGKTRLSVEAGAGLPGEVWQVELAPLTDPAEVPTAILTALGLRSQALLARSGGTLKEAAVDPLTRLAGALAGRELLIILDNCEHLIAAVARVADELLRVAPGLRLLTTSREPLGIPGERLYPVEPLALPPSDADAAAAAGFPAVRLLLDRAPSVVLDATTAGPVVRICRALDGMPLAIELAAARLRTLPVDVLADRLADRFRLLTGGSRTALPRHQTLRAVVDWSWDLLSEPERALWRRFAVFHGGADVSAVEQVCVSHIEPSARSGAVAGWSDGIDLLGALVDKSLLVLAGGRYRMLETIREYGLQRLAEAGEAEEMRRAHAAYLVRLAAEADPHLRGGEQLTWLRRLDAEHDNLHAAIRAAIEAGDKPVAVALVARLGWYWWLSGHRAEGLTLARDVLALPGEAEVEDSALAHAFAALNGLEGNAPLDEVTAWFHEAERLSGSIRGAHPALRLIGPLAGVFRHGAWDSSAAERVAGLFADPDPWLRAVAKMMSAQMRLNFGQAPAAAEAEMREALDGFRAIGERWGIGFTLSSLSDLAAARGDFGQAVGWQREAIALVREVGLREDLPQMEVKLAGQLWIAGAADESRRTLKQAQESAQDVSLPEVTASVEFGFATLARADGDLAEARSRLTAAVAALGKGAAAPQFHAMICTTRGLVEGQAGDLVRAGELHAQAIRTAVGSNDAPVVALTLVGFADLALRQGDPARAARLLGASVGVRGSADLSLPDAGRLEREARAALGDPGFEAAYAEGLPATAATAIATAGLSD